MYYFIVNPNAQRGLGGKLWSRVEKRLKKRGTAYEAFFTAARGDAWNLARSVSRECTEPGVLVTIGGAGTLNEVVNGLSLDVPLTLAYLSTEPKNDLSRGLGFPRSWKRGLRHILEAKACRTADYGILSYEAEEPAHRRFLMSCGIGIDTEVCRSLLEEERQGRTAFAGFLRPAGFRRVFAGIFRQMTAHPVRGYLLLDGVKKVEFNRIYFAAVHVYPCGSGFGASPRPSEDGKLEVCVVHGLSRMVLLPVLLDLRAGRRRPHKGMRFYRCQELQIHVEEPLPVHVDGESCCSQTDISLSCIRKKLRFL